jgi:hypothetical protein
MPPPAGMQGSLWQRTHQCEQSHSLGQSCIAKGRGMIAANARCLKFADGEAVVNDYPFGAPFPQDAPTVLKSSFSQDPPVHAPTTRSSTADNLMNDLDAFLFSPVSAGYFVVIGQFTTAVAIGFAIGSILAMVIKMAKMHADIFMLLMFAPSRTPITIVEGIPVQDNGWAFQDGMEEPLLVGAEML